MALRFDPILNMPRQAGIYNADAAAFNARVASAGRTLTYLESQANHRAGRDLATAGLTSSKIEFGLLGWANQTANLLRFFSGSATDYGTNTHNAAGKVTTGAAGAINTGFIPSVDGFAGFMFYRVNTLATATNEVFLSTNGGINNILVLPHYGAASYACYGGPQTTQQVAGTTQTGAGLYFASRASATAQQFSRTTSGGGTTVINNSAISGTTGAPDETLALGAYKYTGNLYTGFAQSQYACWCYQKAYLTSTERDALISIMMTWLTDLRWI